MAEKMLVSGKCQAPSRISGQGLIRMPLALGVPREMGRGGGLRVCVPRLPGVTALGLSSRRLPHPPEVSRVVDAEG